jgi:hypothetical protein
MIDDSIVGQFAKILSPKSTIKGSNVRVVYLGGVMKDARLLKTNSGTVITTNGTNR